MNMQLVCLKFPTTWLDTYPFKLSHLTDYLLKEDGFRRVTAKVSGKQKREVGLVVPAIYTVWTPDKKYAEVV